MSRMDEISVLHSKASAELQARLENAYRNGGGEHGIIRRHQAEHTTSIQLSRSLGAPDQLAQQQLQHQPQLPAVTNYSLQPSFTQVLHDVSLLQWPAPYALHGQQNAASPANANRTGTSTAAGDSMTKHLDINTVINGMDRTILEDILDSIELLNSMDLSDLQDSPYSTSSSLDNKNLSRARSHQAPPGGAPPGEVYTHSPQPHVPASLIVQGYSSQHSSTRMVRGVAQHQWPAPHALHGQQNERNHPAGICGSGMSMAAGGSLYVKNLSRDADEAFLYRTFSPYGALLGCQVKVDAVTNKCRGVGFVNFVNPHRALHALQHLQGTCSAEGRILHIQLQAPRAERAKAAAAAATVV